MDESNSSSSVAPTTDELHISDMIDITVKTIDSKNFQFNVENDVSYSFYLEIRKNAFLYIVLMTQC